MQGRSERSGEGNSPVPVQGIEQRIFGCPVRSVVTISSELSELHNTSSINITGKLQKFEC